MQTCQSIQDQVRTGKFTKLHYGNLIRLTKIFITLNNITKVCSWAWQKFAQEGFLAIVQYGSWLRNGHSKHKLIFAAAFNNYEMQLKF